MPTKIIALLACLAFAGAILPDAGFARGGGNGGGNGGGGFGAGGGSGGADRSGPHGDEYYMPPGGGGIRGDRGLADRRFDRSHRFRNGWNDWEPDNGWEYGLAPGFGDRCYRAKRYHTRTGWRTRRIYIC